jgi:hypothetical protein
MVNFHIPYALGSEQTKFVFAIGWNLDADSITVGHSNEGIPEPHIIFCMKAWLKRYEEEQESDFRDAFFGEEQ